MTVGDIKNRVMFQTNNDAEDVGDYLPHLVDYINDGYDQLMNAWYGTHVPAGEHDRLEIDADEPELPEWTHIAIADYATWLVYRNGNPSKQNRGTAFYSAFREVLAKIHSEGGAEGVNEDGTRKIIRFFHHIPR